MYCCVFAAKEETAEDLVYYYVIFPTAKLDFGKCILLPLERTQSLAAHTVLPISYHSYYRPGRSMIPYTKP